jgi:hypothetical protein
MILLPKLFERSDSLKLKGTLSMKTLSTETIRVL